MRFLVILFLTLSCSVLSFGQQDDQVLLKSITVNQSFIMPLTEQPIMIIKGDQMMAARGYELVYSKSTDMVWSQPQGADFSSEQVLEAKKKKDKKDKGKGKGKGKGKKGNGGPLVVTITCLSSTGCPCDLVKSGSDERPVYRCNGCGSCGMAARPPRESIIRMISASGDDFTPRDY